MNMKISKKSEKQLKWIKENSLFKSYEQIVDEAIERYYEYYKDSLNALSEYMKVKE